MTRARTLVVLVALFCLALPAVPAQAKTSNARVLIGKINQVRAAHGLKQLRINKSLSRSSTRYSRRLMATGYFGHMSRIQASRRFSRLGEVLEWRRGHRPGISAHAPRLAQVAGASRGDPVARLQVHRRRPHPREVPRPPRRHLGGAVGR